MEKRLNPCPLQAMKKALGMGWASFPLGIFFVTTEFTLPINMSRVQTWWFPSCFITSSIDSFTANLLTPQSATSKQITNLLKTRMWLSLGFVLCQNPFDLSPERSYTWRWGPGDLSVERETERQEHFPARWLCPPSPNCPMSLRGSLTSRALVGVEVGGNGGPGGGWRNSGRPCPLDTTAASLSVSTVDLFVFT